VGGFHLWGGSCAGARALRFEGLKAV